MELTQAEKKEALVGEAGVKQVPHGIGRLRLLKVSESIAWK